MSRVYVPDAPPRSMPRDAAEWILRQLRRIQEGSAIFAERQTEGGKTLQDHIAAPDPHPQYTLETDALALFSFAAYLGKDAPVDTAFADIGAGWLDLDFIVNVAVTPRGMVSHADGRFSFDYDGVYFLNLSGAMEHDSQNFGRLTYLRLYNHTDAIAGTGIVIGTGRNQEATTLAASALVEISDAEKGKEFGFQIGGGDVYSLVNFQAIGYDVFAVSEWRDVLEAPP